MLQCTNFVVGNPRCKVNQSSVQFMADQLPHLVSSPSGGAILIAVSMLMQRGYQIRSIFGNALPSRISGRLVSAPYPAPRPCTPALVFAIAKVREAESSGTLDEWAISSGPIIECTVPEEPCHGSPVAMLLDNGIETVGDSVQVFLHNSAEKVNIETARMFVDTVREADAKRAIFISKSKATTQALQTVLSATEYTEHFSVHSLQINPTAHMLHAKHFCLTRSEIEAVLKKRMARMFQIPEMLPHDAVAVFFGLPMNTMLRIEPLAHGQQAQMMYRHVVDIARDEMEKAKMFADEDKRTGHDRLGLPPGHTKSLTA